MVDPISPREHQRTLARYALEKMADMIEEAAAGGDDEIVHSQFVMAKSFGMLVRDTDSTALHPTGPWSGLSMVAIVMCDVDLNVHAGELPSLADLVHAARNIPVDERPRSIRLECQDFLAQLEGVQGRVLGYGSMSHHGDR